MHIGMVIECACENECRQFLSKVTLMAKDKRLCSQARAVFNRNDDYFAQLKMCTGGRSLLKTMPEAQATGQ